MQFSRFQLPKNLQYTVDACSTRYSKYIFATNNTTVYCLQLPKIDIWGCFPLFLKYLPPEK